MKTGSVIIGLASALIAIAIVGGAYYMTVVRNSEPGTSESHAVWESMIARSGRPSGYYVNPADASSSTRSERTNTPIKCHDSELGEFWTNASTCSGADLDNRISIAAPFVGPTPKSDFENKNYTDPKEYSDQGTAQTRNQVAAGQPSLRGNARTPPPGLSPECRFPVGKALETERALSAADDPAKSIWRNEYCRWLQEVRDETCEVSWDFFNYREVCSLN